MAQAGMHGLVGIAIRKIAGKRDWLLLGLLLGSIFPDMDNVGVAIATLMKTSTQGIHRTMTHSVFFMMAVVFVFYLAGRWRKDVRWSNLGVGLGLGMLIHSLLDLLIWFNGASLFWPFPNWVNLWANTTPPDWFMKLMDPAEFLFFGLYLWILGSWARKTGTDLDFLGRHRTWMWLEFALFVIFTPLAYLMSKGFLTLFGAFYLFSLFMVFIVTLRMRKTVEAGI
jgi:membrane-bound metal-dependent hydrolase YbcI (DUF457 family)